MHKSKKTLKDVILDILYPKDLVCCACDNEAVTNKFGVCESCAKKLRYGTQLPVIKNICEARAGLVYNEISSMPIMRFKYSKATYLIDFFVQFMAVDPKWNIDLVIPVPLHKARHAQRGYNQSALLAKGVCSRFNLRLDESSLIRTRNTKSQTRMDRKARLQNLKGAFSASNEVAGKVILLVDDVLSTGSTLGECARTLLNAGASKVYAICACYNEFR